MNVKEIYEQKWKIPQDLVINHIRSVKISKMEREFHINIVSCGYNNPDQEEAYLTCSIPKYITRLAHNSNFLLKTVLTSEGLEERNGIVLQVQGVLEDTKLISVKLRRIQLSPEERKRRGDLLKKTREKQ